MKLWCLLLMTAVGCGPIDDGEPAGGDADAAEACLVKYDTTQDCRECLVDGMGLEVCTTNPVCRECRDEDRAGSGCVMPDGHTEHCQRKCPTQAPPDCP